MAGKNRPCQNNYVRCMCTLGNGDFARGKTVLHLICERLEHARNKHKWPQEAEGLPQAIGVISAEMREVEYALEHESEGRTFDELLDVIAPTIRVFNGEHLERTIFLGTSANRHKNKRVR